MESYSSLRYEWENVFNGDNDGADLSQKFQDVLYLCEKNMYI